MAVCSLNGALGFPKQAHSFGARVAELEKAEGERFGEESHSYADSYSAVLEGESLEVGRHQSEGKGCDPLEGTIPRVMDRYPLVPRKFFHLLLRRGVPKLA